MKLVDPQISIEDLIQLLMRVLELYDQETANHSYRVAELSLRLGRNLELSSDDLVQLRMASLLHDFGKVGTPAFILYKPGALIEQERKTIERHPSDGAILFETIPPLHSLAPIIRHHHERWDGTGYPRKISGEEIPYLARICAIAEVFDSLVNDQAYRKAWPTAKALQEIEKNSGKLFDPTIVASLLKLIRF